MSDDTRRDDADIEPLTRAEREAGDAVRALPRPVADPVFRARLEGEFVSGAMAARDLAPDVARRRPGAERGGWRPALAWTAAAAALIAVAIGINRGPHWQVTSTAGDAIAVVDRRAIPLGHAQELAAALHPGARLQVPAGGSMVLAAGQDLMIQVTPGTDFTLPPSPGRWLARGLAAEVRTGEIRITTGPAFHGARLAVLTPEARVMVTGTTLAVICEPTGTCVCVLEGRVGVGPRGGSMAMVESGHRRYLFRDGHTEMAEMRTTERVPLAELRQHFQGNSAE